MSRSVNGPAEPTIAGEAAVGGEPLLPPGDSARIAFGGPPVPRGVKVRQYRQAARLWLPAVATFLATLAIGGMDEEAAMRAAILGMIVVSAARLLSRFPYPTRLIPASRLVLALLPSLTGAVASIALELAGAPQFALALVAPGLLVGATVALVVEAIGDMALVARPLRIAVLGGPEFVPAIRRELDAIGGRPEFEIVGWLNVGQRACDEEETKAEALRRVRKAITEHEIDLLVRGPGSAAFRSGRDAYALIAAGCLDLPVRMIEGNQLYEQTFGHVPIGTIDSAWFLFLMHPSFQASSKLSKRAVDIVVGLCASIIAMPLVLIGAVAIKIGDRGPVFYRQRRVGERGKEFAILKLRTMAGDAQGAGARWSAAADSRVTPVGRVLRRLHVDELPQLVNVLKGEMTLVGPRPEQPAITAELEHLFPHYSRRLLVKPGVTGWAQVRCGYAGSELGTAWKLCHDLFYLKHRSLLADFLIMLETVVIATRDSHRPLRAPQPQFLYRVRTSSVSAVSDDVPATPEIPLDAPGVQPTPAGVPMLG